MHVRAIGQLLHPKAEEIAYLGRRQVRGVGFAEPLNEGFLQHGIHDISPDTGSAHLFCTLNALCANSISRGQFSSVLKKVGGSAETTACLVGHQSTESHTSMATAAQASAAENDGQTGKARLQEIRGRHGAASYHQWAKTYLKPGSGTKGI
ncbi:hypothetical protein FQZ97_1116360 [compost metagenome]